MVLADQETQETRRPRRRSPARGEPAWQPTSKPRGGSSWWLPCGCPVVARVVALWLPWWFPPQETELRGGEELCNLGGAKLGKAEAIFPEPAPAMIKSGGISSIVSEPYSTARRCSVLRLSR